MLLKERGHTRSFIFKFVRENTRNIADGGSGMSPYYTNMGCRQLGWKLQHFYKERGHTRSFIFKFVRENTRNVADGGSGMSPYYTNMG